MSYFKDFFGGLVGIMMAILPVTILWQVLTGGLVFGMDVINNIGSLVSMFGDGGFVGLVIILIIIGAVVAYFQN